MLGGGLLGPIRSLVPPPSKVPGFQDLRHPHGGLRRLQGHHSLQTSQGTHGPHHPHRPLRLRYMSFGRLFGLICSFLSCHASTFNGFQGPPHLHVGLQPLRGRISFQCPLWPFRLGYLSSGHLLICDADGEMSGFIVKKRRCPHRPEVSPGVQSFSPVGPVARRRARYGKRKLRSRLSVFSGPDQQQSYSQHRHHISPERMHNPLSHHTGMPSQIQIHVAPQQRQHSTRDSRDANCRLYTLRFQIALTPKLRRWSGMHFTSIIVFCWG
jgi:hypothetical protein